MSLLDEAHQIGGVGETVFCDDEGVCVFRRVAAQGHNVAVAGLVEVVDGFGKFVAIGSHAGEVRHDVELVLVAEKIAGFGRSVAGAAACSIGYGNEVGLVKRQVVSGFHQLSEGLLCFWRKELNGQEGTVVREKLIDWSLAHGKVQKLRILYQRIGIR